MPVAVSIVLQPPLDALFPDSVDSFTSTSPTVLGTLRELCATSERSRASILRADSLSPFVHVFVNGSQVAADAVSTQILEDQDELCLLTAIRGG